MKYERIAQEIYAVTGPAANITSINHCMTRLRLYLAQRPADMEA
ncbi:MAG: PTS transporter subunit EIIB, partial [Selenomonas sp.]|nr:PTS transporter subunit EIIB [Selenomonas sp.]